MFVCTSGEGCSVCRHAFVHRFRAHCFQLLPIFTNKCFGKDENDLKKKKYSGHRKGTVKQVEDAIKMLIMLQSSAKKI